MEECLGLKRAKELGLMSVFHAPLPSGGYPLSGMSYKNWYTADDIHRLLGGGLPCLGFKDKDNDWCIGDQPSELENEPDTHSMLVIGIRAISQESEERKLLREFVACCAVDDPKLRWGELRLKVLALLERSEK